MDESPNISEERRYEEEDKKMKNMIEEPLLYSATTSSNPKGGIRTIPFIIVNEAFEKVASYGLSPNMIFYLIKDYHLELATGNNILLYWSAATNALPILGAFLADSYTGRFSMIALGSIFSFLGMILLWSTAMLPQARPPPCTTISTITSTSTCTPASTFQLFILCSSFGLLSMGAGGIRSSSTAFGADQLVEAKNSRKTGGVVLERYFSWYSALTSLSVVIALTLVVAIQDKYGWIVGFGVPVVLMFLSAVSFFLASPIYIKLKAKSSLLTGFAQVIVVSFKNRHLHLPNSNTTRLSMYYSNEASTLTVPTDKLRFLNKACIVRDSQQDSATRDSWSVCTVDQVEELKALLKIIPIWSTGVLMSVTLTLPSFQVLQASSMDRHVTSWFEIPAGSFGLFTVITITIWVALYDRVILPLASAIMGKPVHFTPKQRMGMGIFMSILSMTTTGVVEHIRRGIAFKAGISDDPDALVPMSAMWLILPSTLSGLSDALNMIAQNEFFFSEFPRSMSSIAVCVQLLGMSVANLVASFIQNVIDNVTKSGGKTSWIASNINQGHYDYYAWFLAGLSVCNMMYFFLCTWAYGPCKEVVRIGMREGLSER